MTGALAFRNFAFMLASLVIAALTGTSALSGHIYRPYLPASRVSQPPRMGMNPFDRFRRRKGEAGKEVAEIISDEVAESKAAIRFARAWAAKAPVLERQVERIIEKQLASAGAQTAKQSEEAKVVAEAIKAKEAIMAKEAQAAEAKAALGVRQTEGKAAQEKLDASAKLAKDKIKVEQAPAKKIDINKKGEQTLINKKSPVEAAARAVYKADSDSDSERPTIG